MFDLAENGARVLLAKGGDGGIGNIHFKSSVNRAPRQFTFGKEGEQRMLRFELKVLADVGLLGMPNAGKSTLIWRYPMPGQKLPTIHLPPCTQILAWCGWVQKKVL